MKIIITALFSLFVTCTFALTETIDGVTWNYSVVNGDATVTSADVSEGGTVEIPAILGGYPVRTIGARALASFNSDKKLFIIVPASVTNIYESAFASEWQYATYTTSSNVTNIFFRGDCPNVIDVDNHVQLVYYIQGYMVEGSSGWPQITSYSNGTYANWYGARLYYGAVPVTQLVNEHVVSDKCILAESDRINIECINNRAQIFFTLDGSAPKTNTSDRCFLYDGPITLVHKATVKAIAYVPEYPYTIVSSMRYAFGQVLTPLIDVSDGSQFYLSGKLVMLSCETEDAEIRYTLDGSEPTEESALYTGAFAIDDTTTVKAKAYKTDWFESETATATFTREWYTVETPDITPGDTIFANASQEVSISCGTEDAIILYTTDGSDPATNGREYTKPFAIYKSCTVRAIAVKYDWKDSPEATATFTRGESLSEAANFYGYTMETDSAAPWTVDAAVSHDGVSSVRSGAIGNNGTTYLMASVKKAGTVSFWWKAQCEEPDEEDGEDGYYDYGAFLVDDVVKARIAGNDTGWRFVFVEVPTGGKHVLRWEYRKDGATSYAPDCVWVDQVQWSPADGSGYTLTSPEPVPYSWLSQYGLGVASGDFEAAANAASGKLNCGRPTEVWEEYVAGLDPTNANSQLKAMIEMHGETPIVTWDPNLNEDGVERRLYKVYGSETLENGGAWQYPTNSLHRFFKVTVEMP